MHRLFVALRPPPPFRAQLLAHSGGIVGARWQEDAQLHVTLRFIGQVDRHRADDIAAALEAVDGPRPMLAVAGIGTFAKRDVAHTLWAGVARDDALLRLRERVERALGRAGTAPDRRAFHPHITLARLNRACGPLETYLAEVAALAIAPIELDHFILYESHLGHAGAQYEPVVRYPLRPSTSVR